MLIRNLSPWAGPNFSFVYGDIIDVPDQTGADRIAGGVAEAAPPGAIVGQTIPDIPAYHQVIIDEQAKRLADASDGSAPPAVDDAVEEEPAASESDSTAAAKPAGRSARRA